MTLSDSTQARARLVEALELDLIGPTNDHAFAKELLPRSPRNWYLTGMLMPVDAKVEAKEDPAAHEDLDAVVKDGGADDGGAPDKGATRRSYLPSSIGLSFLVKPGVRELPLRVEWGEYEYEVDGVAAAGEEPEETEAAEGQSEAAEADKKPRGYYRRTPHSHDMVVTLGTGGGPTAGKVQETPVPGVKDMVVAVVARAIDPMRIKTLPSGTLSVSVFLVNKKTPDGKHPYRAAVFQPRLILPDGSHLVPRSDLRGEATGGDWDDKVADLQYRDAYEYAVGHGVSVRTVHTTGAAPRVETAWIPSATVERVEPTRIDGVELSMERLAQIADATEAGTLLDGLGRKYAAWIANQAKVPGLTSSRQQTLADLSRDQNAVLKRIEAGVQMLQDPLVLEAFRIANRAMAAQARRRQAFQRGMPLDQTSAPQWRPFQLAFLLMGLRGIVDPKHDDRELVDLLFFPTGGGKTEAYLGLAAFTLVLRRLRDPKITSAGVTVLMRYTLRLLTLDQLGRAAALICALELERQKDKARLGEHPFEIGLWVGQGATPNKMGAQAANQNPHAHTALARTLAFRNGHTKTPPIPLEACPWCGTKFGRDSFYLAQEIQKPRDLHVVCVNRQCDFTGSEYLPIIAVDEPLYRRLPCFVISTVDKFAALPWTAEVGQLMGHVDRYEQPTGSNTRGFSRGGPGVPVKLQPPDLIIQDELHLISGPLGTVAGIYEGALDRLATRTIDGKPVRPKIVASTATVRRADAQIRSLFNRSNVTVFPPAGPDRRDSFFARTESEQQTPGRLYVGVAAQGRSMKVVYLRTLMALMAAAQRGYEEGRKDADNPMDPYMSVVGYFNSLRELGGSRRIAEDELSLKLKNPPRQRKDPQDDLFKSRTIQQDPLELTSRVETDQVAEAKHRLGLSFSDKDHVDLALATNMISVGLDITRLGLMVVLGQPKGSSEYIQATSRVGRDRNKPGLVVTLLNVHKPRDRSHYERFETYHQTFYRSVEATSVTPSAPRALDRALAPALVGLVRHLEPGLYPNNAAGNVRTCRSSLDKYVQYLADRAADAVLTPDQADTRARVLQAGMVLLDQWVKVADEAHRGGLELNYVDRETGGERLLREVLDPQLASLSEERQAFRMPRSMRDVEASVDLTIPGRG